MTDRPDDDEDAFRWAGDDDRGQNRPMLSAPDEPELEAPAPAEPARPGGVLLAVIFAVPYLALTVGWVLAVQRTSSGTTELGTEILWQFGEFLAIVAAPLWFGATVSLTRGSRAAARLGWFALGVGVLVPWPLVLGVLGALSEVAA